MRAGVITYRNVIREDMLVRRWRKRKRGEDAAGVVESNTKDPRTYSR